MPAKFRLSRTDFTRMRGFKRVHGTLFSLSYGNLPERASPGFACVVAAKMAPRANTRNRIKRHARTAAQSFMRRLPSSMTIVFYAKKPAAQAEAVEIRNEILTLATKAGCIG